MAPSDYIALLHTTQHNTTLFIVTAVRTSNPTRKIKTEWIVAHMGD
jgi:hypothetical protein